MKWMLLLLAIWTPILSYGSDMSANADFRSHLDQAKFFVKKGWLEDAKMELEKATADPNGQLSAEVWYLFATVQLQLCDLAGAQHSAARAHTHAKQTTQLMAAEQLTRFLTTQFGWVKIDIVGADAIGSIRLTSLSPILDTELKQYFNRIAQKWTSEGPLPHRIGLPLGKYRLNGRDIDVVPDQPVVIQLFYGDQEEASDKRLPQNQIRFHLGTGGGAWAGRRTRYLKGFAKLETGIQYSTRRLFAELSLQWTPHAESRQDGSSRWQAGSAGISLAAGFERPLNEIFLVQAFATYRLSILQPVEFGCTQAPHQCGTDAGTTQYVYPSSVAHIPGAGASLMAFPSGGILGFRATFIAEYAVGRIPSAGTAESLETGTLFEYEVESKERHWSSWGVRIMVAATVRL
jgi:hypothetical protein